MKSNNSEVEDFFEKFEKSEKGELLMDRLSDQLEIHCWDARDYEKSLFCHKCGEEFSELFALALPVGDTYLVICEDCLEEKPSAKDVLALREELRKLNADDIDFEVGDLEDLAVREEIYT